MSFTPAQRSEFEQVAKMAAKEAVSETFLMLGVDVSNPASVISVQGQFSFLRNMHYAARHLRNVIIAGVVGAMVTGAVWAFWTGFKVSAASSIAPISGSR
ncbi:MULTISPECIES: hypothetical protein [unclassified Bradyrhizobium]|uniref:hypothetical protein n=1 Tax=unclassified Bradyrhizobium TaxID=2631580 RepID=UPI001BAAF5E4|nr:MULTISPECIES: hypothetical protein [unclassified Bradyrhizobium]MBR1206629.1 hypothetical protein [Bradyrhizobium sp. AUGA SZCCT0124]MBR1315393.1 hypothetical protein [Bradyrhizobium sp. AUGA SZCCT0051]MBR1338545.1 hypothetical protein [Bradyrhizobium sp. AUGA SZCCT0105]MBR1356200.1 hypothetical protein [Bradyrhizobium sp. AUGA SZCCT0045]